MNWLVKVGVLILLIPLLLIGLPLMYLGAVMRWTLDYLIELLPDDKVTP